MFFSFQKILGPGKRSIASFFIAGSITVLSEVTQDSAQPSIATPRAVQLAGFCVIVLCMRNLSLHIMNWGFGIMKFVYLVL